MKTSTATATVTDEKSYPIYYIFSYWIFAWYVLYICKIVDHFSPKLAIMLGIYYNSLLLAMMVVSNVHARQIYYFFIMMVLLKIIPLITVWRDTIHIKSDIFMTLFLVVLYIIWSISTRHIQNLRQAVGKLTRFLKNRDDKMPGPGMQWLKNHGF